MLLSDQVGALEEPLTGRRWPADETARQVAPRLARYREAGVRPGDRVFLHHGNRLEFFADLLAVWQLGGCVVPIDARLTAFETRTLLGAARPVLAVAEGDIDAAMAAVLDDAGVTRLRSSEVDLPRTARAGGRPSALHLDRDALILFTSGTTGDPKGVVHTHRSLRARWTALEHSLGLDAYRRTLCLLPTHFGHGLICNALYPWLGGQDLLIVPPFQPELLMKLGEIVDEHGVTFLSSVPSVWRMALRTAKSPEAGTLARIFCGSAPLSGGMWKDIRAWAGIDDVFNSYGITETGSWLAGTSVGAFEPEDGLVGVPWGGVLRVLESGSTDIPLSENPACGPDVSGHVWINTPALMRGYFERDDLTDACVRDGWFVTGDIGVIDERGWLVLRGREREEINKGGMKVYPGDVDAVAEQHDAVTDVCTFAVDDRHYGQNVGIALVVSRDDDASFRELHALLVERLAEYQRPVRWVIVDEIPRTSRGKINRASVAEGCAKREAVDLRRVLARS